MKLSLLAILITVSASGTTAFAASKPSPTTCKILIEEGTKNLALTKERFRVGEVTVIEVSTAELDLLDSRLDCNDIVAADYCKAALPAAQLLVDGTLQEANVGAKTPEDVASAKIRQALVQDACK